MADKIKELFDTVLLMEPGQKMIIPAVSEQHRESLRVGIYKEKAKWKKACISDEDILVSRFKYDDKVTKSVRYGVRVEKISAAPPPFILDENDELVSVIRVEQTLELEECFPKENSETSITEEARMRAMMKQDGVEQEEIDEYFKGGEDDPA